MEENVNFFTLPYWYKLDVRHYIDIMHVEKNICDSLILTFQNIKGKTKDECLFRLGCDEYTRGIGTMRS